MILRIFSLLFVFLVVSGNPISQAIPPQQCAYHQNMFNNQPSSSPTTLQQQAKYFVPYTQPLTMQNQLAPSYQENYEVFPFSDDINQILYKRFPKLQPILDPNYSTYSQNEFESQVPNSPDYRTPNIVNNYIIVPSDCFKCNDTPKIKPRINISNEGTKSNKERKPRRKSGNQNPDNIPKAIIEPSASITKPIESKVSIKLKENPGETRERNKKPKDNITRENKTDDKNSHNQEINRDEHRQTRKQSNKIANKLNNDNLEVDNNQVEDLSEKVNSNNQRNRNRKSKPKNNASSLIESLQPNDNNQNKDYVNLNPPQADQKIENSYELFENLKFLPCQKNTNPMASNQNTQRTNLPYKTVSNHNRDNGYQKSGAKDRISDSHKTKDCPHNYEGKQILKGKKIDTVEDINTFPNIPAEMQNIMTYMNSNFNGKQFSDKDIFSNYPFNYDNLYQRPVLTDPANKTKKNKRRKRPRRPHNRNRKGIKNKTTPNQTETKIETANTVVETIKTTTDIPIETNIEFPVKIFEIPMTIPHKIYSQMEEQNKKPSEEESNHGNISKVNEHNSENADLFKNIELSVAYDNGLIYDYYPDFTESTGIYANDNEYYVRYPAYHKYYDENNRKLDIDILNQERIRYGQYQNLCDFGNNRETLTQMHIDPKRNEYIVHNESYEEVTTSQPIIEKKQNPKVDEILFKTPPALEFPDFRTEKVNKDFTDPESLEPYYNFNDNSEQDAYIDDLLEKSSIYSIAKTPMYNKEAKPYKLVQKPKTTNIETVFVNSKVVQYSQPPNQSEVETSRISEINDNININGKIYTTDGSTIVIAESLGYPEEPWYT